MTNDHRFRRVTLGALAHTRGGTFPSNTFDFRWAVSASPGILGTTPRADQVLLRATRTQQCRSLHLEFAAGGEAQSAGLVLLRGGRRAVSADQVTDTRGSLDARVSPGRAWTLAGRTPAISISVYVDGWAMCRSTGGVAAGASTPPSGG